MKDLLKQLIVFLAVSAKYTNQGVTKPCYHQLKNDLNITKYEYFHNYLKLKSTVSCHIIVSILYIN